MINNWDSPTYSLINCKNLGQENDKKSNILQVKPSQTPGFNLQLHFLITLGSSPNRSFTTDIALSDSDNTSWNLKIKKIYINNLELQKKSIQLVIFYFYVYKGSLFKNLISFFSATCKVSYIIYF